MKTLKITLSVMLLASVIGLSSCGKKDCHKPEDIKPKHGCTHSHDETQTETTTSSESGT